MRDAQQRCEIARLLSHNCRRQRSHFARCAVQHRFRPCRVADSQCHLGARQLQFHIVSDNGREMPTRCTDECQRALRIIACHDARLCTIEFGIKARSHRFIGDRRREAARTRDGAGGDACPTHRELYQRQPSERFRQVFRAQTIGGTQLGLSQQRRRRVRSPLAGKLLRQDEQVFVAHGA